MTNNREQIVKNYVRAVKKRDKWIDKNGIIGVPDFGLDDVLVDMARNKMTQSDIYDYLKQE